MNIDFAFEALRKFTFHIGFVHPLQDVALYQCLPLSSVAFLFPVVPSFFAVLSCHLLLGRPLDLFPLLCCHCVQRLVHLLSFILAICPAHFHVCFSGGLSILVFPCFFSKTAPCCSDPGIYFFFCTIFEECGLSRVFEFCNFINFSTTS